MFKIRRKNQFWTFMLDTPLFLCLHHLDTKWENFFCPRVLSQIFRLSFKGQDALKVFWRQPRAKYPAESFMLDFALIRHPSIYESRLDPGKRWKYYPVVTRRHTDTHMCAGSCWCDLSRARGETRSLSVQSNHQVCIPPALQPCKRCEKRKPGVQRFLSLSFALQWNGIPPASHPRGEGQRSRSVTFFRLTCPRSGWSAGPCCDGWGRCKYPAETPRWMGVGWAHTAGSWLCLQGAMQSRCQRDECGLCSGGPGERVWGVHQPSTLQTPEINLFFCTISCCIAVVSSFNEKYSVWLCFCQC